MPRRNDRISSCRPNRALQDVLEEQAGGHHFSHLLDAAAGDAAATRRLLLAGTRIDRITVVDREVDREATVARVHAAAARPGSSDVPLVHVVERDLMEWVGADRSPFHDGTAENAAAASGAASETASGAASETASGAASETASGAAPRRASEPASETASGAASETARFDACVLASSLHHFPRHGRMLERLVDMLSGGRCAERSGYLIVWEPIRSAGTAAALHEIKAAVDRALGMSHAEPFHRETLERTLEALEPRVVWSHRELVRPWRSELTNAEYHAAINDTAEYLALVRGHRALYSALRKRLSTLPSRPDQPWGEPHLVAFGSLSAYPQSH